MAKFFGGIGFAVIAWWLVDTGIAMSKAGDLLGAGCFVIAAAAAAAALGCFKG